MSAWPQGVLVALAAFAAMEPVTYLAHRYVMHGPGYAWHRSHHGPRRGRLEANDLFPVVAAGLTVAAMALGATVPGWGWLLAAGVGVTAYGLAYLIVHDVYAHGRFFGPPRRPRLLAGLARAHLAHHRGHGGPYGFLVPVSRAEDRRRAPR